MDDHDRVFVEIALKALTAILKNANDDRHRQLWNLAIARVQQTRRDVDADEEIAKSKQLANKEAR